MSDRVRRKIEETAALQIRRRDRGGVHDRMGLSTRGTHDPFVEAQVLEQPPSPAVEPGADRDVIVQPTTPPDMGGAMQPPEEPLAPEEKPGDEEPEIDVDEEMKRSLFNTLSELIDLGRIGRNEQEIRKYVEDHEDEIGELVDVLDDVVDMLIGEGTVLREPKTFDIGDREEPPPDMGDFDELKPGAGQQVPQGGTTTTIIASDRSGGNGDALHESIMTGIVSGANIDLTLERAAEELKEETLEYGFDSPEDLTRALRVLDGLGVATTNVMKINPTTLNIVRDDRNMEDVDKQLAAIRAAGIEMREPVAAEGMATPATLVSGSRVGQMSTVRSEGVDEAIFSDWYSVLKDATGARATSHGVDKAAAQAAVSAADPGAAAKVVRAGSERDAIAKYERRTADIRSPEARQARMRRGVGALKTAGRIAAKPITAPVKMAGKLAGGAVQKLMQLLTPVPGEEPAPGEPAAPAAPVEPSVAVPAPEPVGLAGPGVRHPENAVKVTIDDPTMYTRTLKGLEGSPKVSYARGDGESIWVVSDDPGVKAAIDQMAAEAAATEGYQSWTRPVMNVRAAMGEGVTDEAYFKAKAKAKYATVPRRSPRAKVEGTFGSVEEAEAYARDLHDLGYKNIILEDLNITRTGMAVEVVFGDKGQASAAKGALLQYKGIDAVKDAGNGTLVVFTTDADPEEARNRVTTILQNARVPMEGFKVARFRQAVLEANPGGQSAIGQPVPGISRAYNGPDEMPTPLPTTGGAKGSSIEADTTTEKVDRGFILIWKVGGHDVANAFSDWFAKRYRDAAKSVQSSAEGDMVTAEIHPDSEYASAGTAQALADQAAREFGRGVERIKVAPAEGDEAIDVSAAYPTNEQAGDQDPEAKRRFMQPFYAPDDAELPPGPDVDAIPGPGEEGYEPPDYAAEPGEPGEPGEELEPEAMGDIWRVDVPEDPEEKTRLTDALNQAREAGVLVSWTEIGAPEEPELEPGAEVPPEAGVELEVTPEFANVPTPTGPPAIGEQVDDEREYDTQGELTPGAPEPAPGEVSGIPDVEPGDVPVDELPPEEPEEEEHYIAVEFAAETEQDERDRFPDWITDITADPETGEGGVIVAGWRPEEPKEEIPGEPGEEIPGEIPGETSEISPELSPEFSPELSREFSERSAPIIRGSPTDEVPVPEDRILGESAGHLRNIFKAVRLAEGRGDEANKGRFVEALVTHGHAMRISRGAMARILRESEEGLVDVYPEPAVVEGASSSPDGDAIVLPPDLVRLREDHRAMVDEDDEAGARRVLNELRFQVEAQGLDINDVVNEQGRYPIKAKKMNARGTYKGQPVVIRAFYMYEEGGPTAYIVVGGRTDEVPAEDVELAPGMGEKPAWAAATAAPADFGEIDRAIAGARGGE